MQTVGCNVGTELLNVKVKGKVRPNTGHDGPDGEKNPTSTLSSTSTLDWRA